MYTFQLSGRNLDRKDVFSKSDPFMIVSSARNPAYVSGTYKTQNSKQIQMAGDWVVVHKSETIMNNQKPVWKPFMVDLGQLVHGNMDQPFLIEVYDWDTRGKHDFIGSVATTIRECQVMKDLQLRNPKRKSLKTKIAGMITVLRCEPVPQKKSTI